MSIHEPQPRRAERAYRTGRPRGRLRRVVEATPSPPPFLADSPVVRAVRRRDRTYRAAVLAADLVAALLTVGLATAWLPSQGQSWTAGLLVIGLPLVHAAHGLYQRDARVVNKNTLDEAPALFRAAAMTTVLVYLVQSALLKNPIGAKVIGFDWLALTLIVPTCRVFARAAVRELLPPERCLVLGDDGTSAHLAHKLEQAIGGIKSRVVGAVPLARAGGHDPQRLAETVEGLDVHRVVIAAGTGTPQEELEAIQAAKALGVRVSVLPRVLEVVGSSAVYDYVDGLTFLGVPEFGMARHASIAKRCSDVAVSLAGLLVAGPLMLLIALAVKLSGPGPVFFRQQRIGRDGEPFSMLKFRSMIEDADRLKDDLRERNEQDGLFKIADDPRITRVGRILRRTSLDELPQVLNVLRGDMSLVGPRPLVPEEDAQIQGWHRRRLQLMPGMTGPWQVLGSSRIPLSEMVTIDYLYVANWSIWSDVKILLRTFGVVFARRGR